MESDFHIDHHYYFAYSCLFDQQILAEDHKTKGVSRQVIFLLTQRDAPGLCVYFAPRVLHKMDLPKRLKITSYFYRLKKIRSWPTTC